MQRVSNTTLMPESALLERHLEEISQDVAIAHFDGLPGLDDCLGGVRPGLTTVIAAKPSCGKTTLLGQMADELAAQGIPCLFLTEELPASRNLTKSITRLGAGSFMLADIPNRDENSEVGKAVRRAISQYQSTIAPNMYYIEHLKNEAELAHLVAECGSRHGVAPAVFVDYLQLIAMEEPSSAFDERAAINRFVKVLGNIAKEFNAPVFALSSVSRTNYEKQRAGLDVFGGSQGIEYGVDNALFMSIDGNDARERQANMERPIRPVTLTAIKIRYGTPRCVALEFDAEHAVFRGRL